jgi:SMC interacting uncharacterized protein involved in chromosome segregation
MRVRVEGHPNLYRDERTGAIIDTDTQAYENYVNALSQKEGEKREIMEMKNEIQEIKSLLKQLVNKNESI